MVLMWIVGLLVLPVVLAFAYQYVLESSKPGKPPVVRSYIPFLGSGVAFGKDPLGFLKKCQSQYGDIFTILVPGWKMTFLMNPADYPSFFRHKDIFQFKPAIVPIELKGFGYSREEAYRFHERLPNLWASHLAGPSLDPLATRVELKVTPLVTKLNQQIEQQQGKWVEVNDLNDMMVGLMYQVGTEAIYGDNFPLATSETWRHDLFHFNENLALIASNAPSFLIKRALNISAKFRKFFSDNKAYPNQSALTSTRQSWYASDPKIPSNDTGGAHFALFSGVHSNTPTCAFWVLYHLLKHPEAYLAIRKEVDDYFKKWENGKIQEEKKEAGSDGANLQVDRETLKDLVLLESAINESMRLSSSNGLMRVCCVDEYPIPNSPYKLEKGDGVFIFTPTTHYDPELFPDPQAYKYNRFVETIPEEEKKSKYINPYKNGEKIVNAFLPFGGGVSICPGRFFAIIELKILIMHLVREFDFELVDPSAPFPAFDVSHGTLGLLPPVGKIPCRFRKRQF